MVPQLSNQVGIYAEPVLSFLLCRTPEAWVSRAIQELPTLLLDHISLELRAAQQAQNLIRRYGGTGSGSDWEFLLIEKMSRLAREELRHFEQVLSIIERRGIRYRRISASRYASALHSEIRQSEPERLIDTLIVGAIIEARSCERFFCLCAGLGPEESELAVFYGSLLKAECRHFQGYLSLAERVGSGPIADRVEFFLMREKALILQTDTVVRFHSGVPEGNGQVF
jgi:tRNA-(ms[2]io[6]A)-hydroxylase